MPEAGPAGWEARLALRFEQRAGRTVLAHRSREGPLAVQKSFYPEGDVATCTCCIRRAVWSAAIGWRSIEIASNAHAVITTPAAAKFYRSAGSASMQEQLLSVATGAVLEWLPQETVLYAQCRTSLSTRVTLAPGARFIGWEVLCLGRPAANECFDAGVCRQRLELWCEDRPLVIERSTIAGGSDLLRAPWGFGGCTVSGTFLATPADKTIIDPVRETVAVEAKISSAPRSSTRCSSAAISATAPNRRGGASPLPGAPFDRGYSAAQHSRHGFGGREWTSPGKRLDDAESGRLGFSNETQPPGTVSGGSKNNIRVTIRFSARSVEGDDDF